MSKGTERFIANPLTEGGIIHSEKNVATSPQELELNQFKRSCTELNGQLSKVGQKQGNTIWMDRLIEKIRRLVIDVHTFNPDDLAAADSTIVKRIEHTQQRVTSTIMLIVRTFRLAGIPLSIFGEHEALIDTIYQRLGGDQRAFSAETAALLQNFYEACYVIAKFRKNKIPSQKAEKAIATLQRQVNSFHRAMEVLCQDQDFTPEREQAMIVISRCQTKIDSWQSEFPQVGKNQKDIG